MAAESNWRRDSALALIRDLPATLFVVEVSPDTERRLRRNRAITAVVDECCLLGASHLVFELDVSVIERDRRTVARALHKGVNAGALTYDFVLGSAEPLLWRPDAVAWAWARGWPWRGKLPDDTRHIRA